MGFTSYSVSDRSHRAKTLNYATASVNEIFQQNEKRTLHESMSPSGLTFRECFDSEVHPNTIPIVLSLDVTGSMGRIPHQLVKDGLPTLMGNLVQRGVADASLLFLAVGDHEHDRCPLQVGQFESGDAELDLWLTRTYLEGGGGANAGESYLLAWYLAAFHTKTDAFTKRGKKGYLFTVGDEPCLRTLPKYAIEGIMSNNTQKTFTDVELLEEAQRMYNVYHIHVMHSAGAERSLSYWKKLLGQNCIELADHTKLAEVVSEVILSNESISPVNVPSSKEEVTVEEDVKITL